MGDILWFILKWFLLIVAAWAVLSYIISPRRTFGVINSTWHHSFDNQAFSPMEFYEEVGKKLKGKDIDSMHLHIVEYNEDQFVFTKRKYMQVHRHNQMLLICAAPFGKDFFVSWRLGTPIDFMHDLFLRLPLIGPAFARMVLRKTFYQQDADTMFKEAVHHAVLAVIEEMTTANGIRSLTESEQKPTDIPQSALRF